VPYQGYYLYEVSISASSIGGVSGGQVAGSYANGAAIQNTPDGAIVSLHPTSTLYYSSSVHGTNGVQQVGSALGSEPYHAFLWNGTAESAVDLHPTQLIGPGYSEAFGTNGIQQVGVGNTHALMWMGTPESAIDLHPSLLPHILGSIATATDGLQQVGWGWLDANYQLPRHALVWSGTAESAVDLHPTNLLGFEQTTATGVSSGQQVGYGNVLVDEGVGRSHALLWTGTADTALDLHPVNLSQFTDSLATATNGNYQVGAGASLTQPAHALLWNGTAESAIDLHVILPPGFSSSNAYSIDATGTIYGIAYDAANVSHAVMWVPVPEPRAAILAIAGALAFTMTLNCFNHSETFRPRL
jgi:hypothetical protein